MSAPIADLAALLMSHGLSSDVVRSCLDLAEQHAAKAIEDRRIIGGSSADVVRSSSDTSAERRKEYDRKRQAEIRRLKRLSEKPPLILTSLSSSEETLKKERKKESSGIRARAQLVPIPDDWKPSEHAFEVAEKYGSSVSDTEPIFLDYLKSSGKRYADYDAAFYNFLRNQRKFNGQNNGQSNGKPKSAIIQAADDLCRKIAEFDGPPRDRDEIRSGESQNPPRLLSYR